SAGTGGGVFNDGDGKGGGGFTNLTDTILKTGVSGANLVNSGGSITSLGYNLSNDDGGGFLGATGDQINTDPIIGPLQDNGGLSFTRALLTGSPAIDTGDPAFDPNNLTPPLTTDQRGPGFARVANSVIDK